MRIFAGYKLFYIQIGIPKSPKGNREQGTGNREQKIHNLNEKQLTINKLFVCAIALVAFWLAQSSIAKAEKLTCFADICIDYSSVELIKSDVPGAPNYDIRTFLGTQKFSNERLLAQMEVDCKQRQFRTVRVSEDGENWSNFDPRWTLIAGNSSLSRLVDYTCQLPIATQ